VKEGYLYRVRGRGTFVRARRVEANVTILSSFTDSMRATVLDVDTRVRLCLRIITACSSDGAPISAGPNGTGPHLTLLVVG